MNKRKWGGIRKENEDIKRLHEEWAIKNGYRENELLHGKNTEAFIKGTTTYDSQTISTEEVECEII